jgi:hypothetical protein
LDLPQERWQIVLDGIPEDIPGNVEVVMNDFVADAAHLGPW